LSSVSRQGKKAGEGVQNQNSRENFRYDRGRGGFYERPKWSPPKLSSEPIPSPECPYCGKPIRDLSAALNDRASGEPVHFDCVIARLGESEALDRGDALAYIGGGRFGVVRFAGPLTAIGSATARFGSRTE
jgi:hypothetical protein